MVVRRSIEEGARKGRPPTAEQRAILAEEPRLGPFAGVVLELAIRALNDLDTCRPVGMVVGKIPWTAIVAWVEHHARADLDDDARAILIDVIRSVDDAEHAEATRKSEAASKPRRAPQPARGGRR